MTVALLKVQREFSGLSDHLRSYKVVIDKEEVGQLGPGESQVFEVSSGSHELFLEIDWCRSETITLELEAGQTAAFCCAPNGNAFTELYWISFGRRRYIRLTRVEF